MPVFAQQGNERTKKTKKSGDGSYMQHVRIGSIYSRYIITNNIFRYSSKIAN